MPASRLSYLFQQYLERAASAEEREELFGLAQQPAQQAELTNLMEAVEIPQEFQNLLSDEDSARIWQAVGPVRVISLWKKMTVAASILLLVGLGSYFVFFHETTSTPQAIAKYDIEAPRQQRAVITLADGSKVYLDSLAPGVVAQQQQMEIVRHEDGQLSYRSLAPSTNAAIIYNTLENPRGSQVIDLTLADGSRVWLNAGSSITYPVSFNGNTRTVTMNGEAYYEVAHDALHPFVVSKGTTQVTVLGTHFNVNAYDDETTFKVTLLEGSVKVNETTIKPGQQAMIGKTITIKDAVDIEAIMAWKNGLFNFNGADLETVMRQLSRWYDLEVVYDRPDRSLRFGGKITRDLNLSQVLKLLGDVGVKFTIDGKKLNVSH